MENKDNKVEQKSIIIIGAGIAGLSAGCYGQMNGYRTQIFEMQDEPGGLCTSWERKGYTIDGCLHWLVGSSPANNFYHIWEELGVVQGRRMIYQEELMRIEGADSKIFILYTNIDRLKQHMMELAPEDKDVIEEFIEGARACTRFELPIERAPEVYGTIAGFKSLAEMRPFIQIARKWANISIQDFAARFKNASLREAFPLAWWFPELTMLVALMSLAWVHRKVAGYPVSGSLEVSRTIKRRYCNLGGEVHYHARVTEILVENDRAIGIRLEDGSQHRADYVISAADGHTTIFDMLDGKYVDEKIRGHYDNLPVCPSLIHVALGVNRSFEEIPPSVMGLNFPLDKPVTIADREWGRLGVGVHIYNFDPTLAPAGKTVVKVMFPSDYAYWRPLRDEPERYKQEKEQIADQVVVLLDKRFPGLAAQVEMRDVATPLTFHRYTGNWQGTFEGWMITPGTWRLRMSKTLPGLDAFYMVGQWVEPGGGVPMVAMSGRNAIQMICRQDKKPFAAKIP
jgi:phytoene dehydrogenase-like protein